jgi:hypothetical protein
MKPEQQIIRFGILTDQLQLKNWQIKSIERLLEVEGNELVVIFLPQITKSYDASALPIGFRFLERQLRQLPLLQTTSIEDKFKSIPKVQLNINKKGFSNYIDDQGIDQIESHQLNVILRFGFGIIRGKVLDIPTYGIWSFHHGNPEQFRGGPPAFWEFLQEKSTNGLILQRLTNELDAGIILRQARIKRVSHSFLAHNDRLCSVSIDFPRWVADAIRNNQPGLFENKITQKGPIYKVPSNWKVLMFYLKLFKSKIAFHYQQLFQFEVWNVGVTPYNDLSQINWAPQPNKSTYQADPFMDKHGNVYFELYDYRTGKGSIAARTFKNNAWSDLNTILSTEVHYSYPFVLEIGEKQYLLPEQYQANEVVIYELNQGQLLHKKHLLKGDWVDATIHEYDGLFWLFCSPQQHSNEELYLFYADSITDNYQPHPLNPIKVDISGSRPGGKLFTDDQGRLIRPSQNSTHTYGGSITLNHITSLSPTNYREERVGAVHPEKDSRYNKALHTFSYEGNYAIIDGKTYRFIWSAFIKELKIKFKRLV